MQNKSHVDLLAQLQTSWNQFGIQQLIKPRAARKDDLRQLAYLQSYPQLYTRAGMFQAVLILWKGLLKSFLLNTTAN